MNKRNNKGFTLAELLIVVAIIAVLVAIAIPVFNTQLEKSREATDAANIRSAYAEVVAASLSDPDNNHSATVTKKQTQEKWQNAVDIAGVKVEAESNDINSTTDTVVKYTAENGTVTIDTKAVTNSFLNASEESDPD